MSASSNELETKLSRLRRLLDQHNADAVLLRRVSSFAWATCGKASYVNTAATEGAASLVVTREKMYLAANNIEIPRLVEEEKLAEQGWEIIVSPWATPLKGLQSLIEKMRLISDVPFAHAVDVSAEVSRLRAQLTQPEQTRFEELGKDCAAAMSAAALAVRPGMTEFELAALLGRETQARGIQPVVNLVATDERAYRYRHPLPTSKTLDKYAMLVLSGRRRGLVCSISRLVHFGKIPDDLQQRIQSTAAVNAVMIGNSTEGASLGEIIHQCQAAYAEAGHPDEWLHHHQGGVTGYESREYLATPGSTEKLSAGQAVAWNPTIAGAKMEDTILAGEKSIKILTLTSMWPVKEIMIPGQSASVPCALALEF